MRNLKRFFSQLYRYVLVALVSVVFWAWVYTLVTDAPTAKKVMLFADVPAMEDPGLAVELETVLPDGIRLVKTHPFSYAMFDATEPDRADILIVPESAIRERVGMLCPIEPRGDGDFSADGKVYGWRVYDPITDTGAAMRYLTYNPTVGQAYYLCFPNASVHLGAWNGSPDDAAIRVAEHLMTLP